jgi:hypothetical protein
MGGREFYESLDEDVNYCNEKSRDLLKKENWGRIENGEFASDL